VLAHAFIVEGRAFGHGDDPESVACVFGVLHFDIAISAPMSLSLATAALMAALDSGLRRS